MPCQAHSADPIACGPPGLAWQWIRGRVRAHSGWPKMEIHMKATLLALAFAFALPACDSRPLDGDHACSIDLDASVWTEPQPGVLEHASVGQLTASDIDGAEAPVVGKMCFAHSSAQPERNGEYLVEDVGSWVQDFPGHSDPQTYVAETHARLGKLAQ